MRQTIKNILTIQLAHATAAAETVQYKSWDDEFRLKNIRTTMQAIDDVKVDFSDLTETEAELLGFGIWTNAEGDPLKGMRLIPLYLYDHLAEGQSLTCIDGLTTFVHADYRDRNSANYIDNDHRVGMLAYGFFPGRTTLTPNRRVRIHIPEQNLEIKYASAMTAMVSGMSELQGGEDDGTIRSFLLPYAKYTITETEAIEPPTMVPDPDAVDKPSPRG